MTLEERAEEAAKKAKCSRCGTVIMQDPGRLGLATGTLRTSALGTTVGFQLCGKCGLVVREAIWPKLLTDPNYLSLRAELMEMWR